MSLLFKTKLLSFTEWNKQTLLVLPIHHKKGFYVFSFIFHIARNISTAHAKPNIISFSFSRQKLNDVVSSQIAEQPTTSSNTHCVTQKSTTESEMRPINFEPAEHQKYTTCNTK